MAIFKNILVAFVLIGLLTRVAHFFFIKKVSPEAAAWLSFFCVGIVFLPLFLLLTAWDVVVAEYLSSLIIWLIFDLIRINVKRKKS